MRHKSKEKFNNIIDFIKEYMMEHPYAPSFREVSAGLGMSLGSVHDYIEELQDRGVLRINGSRKIELNIPLERCIPTPIAGCVVCGEAELSEQDIEGYLALPESMVGDGDYYLLRTHGESMIEAGIEEGDLVLIRRQETAREGQIVVAEYENQTTLKRIYFDDENRRILLHPENSGMDDIVVRNCRIQGIATKLIKDL